MDVVVVATRYLYMQIIKYIYMFTRSIRFQIQFTEFTYIIRYNKFVMYAYMIYNLSWYTFRFNSLFCNERSSPEILRNGRKLHKYKNKI